MNYHLQASILDSWIHSFVYVRNVCAHHSRLWDKILAIAPQLPPGKLWDPVRSGNKRLYCIAMTLNWMLAHDSVDQTMHAEWKSTLSKLVACLFARFPQFQGLTGFPPDWENLEVMEIGLIRGTGLHSVGRPHSVCLPSFGVAGLIRGGGLPRPQISGGPPRPQARPIGHWQHWNWQHFHIGNIFHPQKNFFVHTLAPRSGIWYTISMRLTG